MPKEEFQGPLERTSDTTWRIPKSYRAGMRVDGIVYADDALVELIRHDQALEQVANVAFLPGIQVASLAMPDIHWGYGFCIGGVCATDPLEGGVISPGGVGYDINCGVRLVRSKLTWSDVQPVQSKLVEKLYRDIPTGTGRGGKYRFSPGELRRLMAEGVPYLMGRGLAVDSDLEHTEAGGRIPHAEPDKVSQRALERGYDQCGTLGSGNHFLEVQLVDRVFDEPAARALGLAKDMVCVMIHSGSRGLGYQVCDDALKMLRKAPEKYRQLLMWQARECFEHIFGRTWQELGMSLIYDVAHNIAKFEQHDVGGKSKRVWVHRKGATRAFPPDHPETPAAYKHIGQPVIIPGDMGRASWVLVGQPGSMAQTFGSACHGAGRVMSRTAAVKHAQGRRIDRELAERGIVARARSWKGLAEEQPAAYKDVDLVVEVVHRAGLAKKVARLRPIGVIKG
jgi:tRNA-splicing ligase RtcB